MLVLFACLFAATLSFTAQLVVAFLELFFSVYHATRFMWQCSIFLAKSLAKVFAQRSRKVCCALPLLPSRCLPYLLATYYYLACKCGLKVFESGRKWSKVVESDVSW